MSFHHKIKSLAVVGNFLRDFLDSETNLSSQVATEFKSIMVQAHQENAWFTEEQVLQTLQYWANHLTVEELQYWLSRYSIEPKNDQTIALILAGNIPMVGFHDVISVLLLGYKAQIKLSSKDSKLIPFLLNYWREIDDTIDFECVERLGEYDKVIATGSTNSAQYFEYYFKNKPHIIRKNRTSVAVLSGKESKKQLSLLANDMLQYFGLGCRNVTQILVPKNYDFNVIFEAVEPFHDYIHHHKYANNYDYYRAIFLLNKDLFWDNNVMMLKESNELFSPISVVLYNEYVNLNDVNEFLEQKSTHIQCVVSDVPLDCETIPLGQAQNPELYTYADGVDTISWLLM